MSLKETIVHEYTHAITRNFIEDPANFEARKTLGKLFDRAKDVITPADFLPETPDGRHTQSDRDRAEQRYEYLFNNPNFTSF